MFPPPLAQIARLLAACTLGLASIIFLNPASAHAFRAAWVWPVSGARSVERDYDAPESAYAAGHRGIDIVAEVGSPVMAPTQSVVSFAGTIAGRGILTLRTGDLQISMEAVIPSVAEGELVSAGQEIAVVSTGSHCTCLHVGVRRAGEYLSPMSYFSAIAASVLQPWDDRLWLRARITATPAQF